MPATVTGKRTLRVVEIGLGLGGAVCGRLFAGLGHDVVRCEPSGGDPLRRQQPFNRDGEGLAFVALNADKQSAVLGGSEPARQDVAELLADADVAIVSTPESELADLGLTREHVRDQWPGLVAVWITGFGPSGPYADLPGDSLLAEAYGGLATMIGDGDRRPLALGGDQAAYCAGVTGFFGAMLALLRRTAGHGGDVVDVAMCDVAAYMDWKSDVAFAMTGEAPRRSGADPGDWRLVRARDGWVGFIFQAKHWDAVVDLVEAPELRDPALKDERERRARAGEWWKVVEAWAGERGAEEIYVSAQSLGLPFGWVARPSDLVRSSQLLHRGFVVPDADRSGTRPIVGSPARSDGLTWSRGTAPRLGAGSHRATGRGRDVQDDRPAGGLASPDMNKLPLEGIVVLDFGTITAGAAVTRLLADYGATVLKVEWLDHPDTFRSWKMPANLSAADTVPTSPYFPSNNIGKLGVAVDLKTQEGRAIVHELARRSHVVVENYRVGVTRRLGIDASTLHRINPDLLYVSLSSQGQDGPEASYSSYGSTLDLLSGLAAVTGYDAEHPLWSSSDVNYPDQLVSLFGAAFVAYCLERGLNGLHLDISQREVVSWTLAAELADVVVSGHDAVPVGNRRPACVPRDVYPCAEPDAWIAIVCCSDEHRRALASCLGSAALDGKDQAWWEDHADLVDGELAGWTRQRQRDHAVQVLRAAGVPAVPVLDARDRALDPRFVEDQVRFVDASVPVKGVPLRFSRLSVSPNRRAPGLGEDTLEVLRRFGGLSVSAIEDFEERGIVHLGAPCAVEPARQG